MAWYNNKKKQFCKTCKSKTEHTHALVEKRKEPREKLGFGGWVLVFLTGGVWLLWHWMEDRDETFVYREKCEECGTEEETVSSSERVGTA